MPIRDAADPRALAEVLAEVRRRGTRQLTARRSLAATAVAIAATAGIVAPISLGAGHTRGAQVRVGGTTTPSVNTSVPAALLRPLHLPTLRPDQSCPTTPGRPFDNPNFGGTAFGDGQVRVILADEGDLAHGQVDLGATTVPGWLALKTLWFALPAYDGPFIVRGERLDRPGLLEEGGGQAPTAGPLVVPAGPTPNTFDGYRTQPDGAWVTSPGCYAWQVDGQNSSEIIVVEMRSGVLTGTLEAVGGPAPGVAHPLPGTITLSDPQLPATTITVGPDGKFSVPVIAGSYTITGRSPKYQRGNATCSAPGPVNITLGATRQVTVTCQEK